MYNSQGKQFQVKLIDIISYILESLIPVHCESPLFLGFLSKEILFLVFHIYIFYFIFGEL